MVTIQSSHNSSSHSPLCLEVFMVKTIIHSTNILLILPLSLLVLYLGFQRWRRERAVPISHCDFFTYNLAVAGLVAVSESAIYLYGSLRRIDLKIGLYVGGFPWSGQIFFPIFTCVDRYLAVVRPITYMRLKRAAGMRIRNISAGIVWILSCLGVVSLIFLDKTHKNKLILDVCQGILFFCLILLVTFCCVSVLCVLIGPRPGAAPRHGQKADRSKQRAFTIILIIMVVLCIRFGGSMLFGVISAFPTVHLTNGCALITTTVTMWFNLPCSLVLPLLYLHRARTLQRRKHKPASG